MWFNLLSKWAELSASRREVIIENFLFENEVKCV